VACLGALGQEDCLRLLVTEQVSHIGLSVHSLPVTVPVTFALGDAAILCW